MARDYAVCWKQVSNEPRQFRPSFLKSLWNVDNGRIRLRWSEEYEKYVIERKAFPGMTWLPKLQEFKKRKTDGRLVRRDSFIQAQDGYISIDMANASAPFEGRLCDNLRFYNLERWGGSKGFIRHMEEMELMRNVAKEKEQDDRWAQIANNQYEDMIWRSGERGVVPRNFDEIPVSAPVIPWAMPAVEEEVEAPGVLTENNYDSMTGYFPTKECWDTHTHTLNEAKPECIDRTPGPYPKEVGAISVEAHGALGRLYDYNEEDLVAKATEESNGSKELCERYRSGLR